MKHFNSTRFTPALLLGGAVAAGLVTMRRVRERRVRLTPDSAPSRTSIVPVRSEGYTMTGRTITINRCPRVVYEFWRDFRNLAFVMDNLESVRTYGDRTEWQISAPFGQTVRVETEIDEDQPGRMISWRATRQSDIETRGKVRFYEAPGRRGTVVELLVEYKPPGGRVGRALARMTGKEPAVQARHDLRRLKMLLETGEIADSRHPAQSKET